MNNQIHVILYRVIVGFATSYQHHHTEESHTWTEDNNLGVT